MSTAYAGDDTNYPTNITIPSDGDDKSATSVNPGLEGLADRTASIAKRAALSDLGTVIRPVSSLAWIFDSSGSPSWTRNGGLKLTQVDIDALGPEPNGFHVILQLPHGSTLVSVFACIKGHSGHAVLPVLLPGFTVFKQRINTGAARVSIGTGGDTSANVAAFEAVHSIDAAVNEVIDNSINAYWIAFTGERDIDTAVAGAEFYGFLTQCSVPKLDPGAG
jgi:hypothetical protein